ncbi:MAG: arginine--tRNA ligase [Candidatus Woesearchaeota archaeon]
MSILKQSRELVLETIVETMTTEGFRDSFRKLVDKNLVYQKRKGFGEISLPTPSLLDEYEGMSPKDIADMMRDVITDSLPSHIKIEQKGHFLNFHIDESYLQQKTMEAVQFSNFGFVDEISETVVVEYSSPNYGKDLHIGHIRSTLVGESVSRILQAVGYKVIRINYPGDVGGHMGKVLLGLQIWNQSQLSDDPAEAMKEMTEAYVRFGNEVIDFGTIIEDMYETMFSDNDDLKKFPKDWKAEVINYIYTEPGDCFRLLRTIDGTTEKPPEEVVQIGKFILEAYSFEERQRTKQLLDRAMELNAMVERSDTYISGLWKKVCKQSELVHSEVYKQLFVSFDVIQPASTGTHRGKALVQESLRNGLANEQASGVSIAVNRNNFLKILGNNNTAVYGTLDLGIAVSRFEDFGFDRMVYVVGYEQADYFKKMFTALTKLGQTFSDRCEHLSTGHLVLEDGKMSSREGNVVLLEDVLNMAIDTAKKFMQERQSRERYSSASERSLSNEKIDELAEVIGLGALKYLVLSKDPNSQIKYDEGEAFNLKGKSAPFAQYAYARATSILDKAGYDGNVKFDVDYYKTKADKQLIRKIAEFPVVVQEAASKLKPHFIAEYVHELASEFNRFYNDSKDNPILKETDIAIKNSKLVLIDGFRTTIRNALYLLTIDVPERM